MSEKSVRLLLVFSICLNLGFLGVAGFGYLKHRGDPKPHPRTKKFSSSVIFDTVDLTSRQKEELEQLGDVMQANMVTVTNESSPLKVKVMKLLTKPRPIDDKEMDTLSSQIVEIQGRREFIINQHLKAVRGLLTDEQAEKVFTRFAEIQQKWGRKFRPPHRK